MLIDTDRDSSLTPFEVYEETKIEHELWAEEVRLARDLRIVYAQFMEEIKDD